MKTISAAVSATGYSPSKRTLFRHLRALEGGTSPLSSNKQSGARSKLTEEQMEIVCGAVLKQTCVVGLRFVVEWIKANFGVGVSSMYASRLMSEKSITMQLFGSRSWPVGTTKETYTKGYFDFIQKVRNDGVFKRRPAEIICIDSCTNSVRIERQRGLALKGGRQPVLDAPKPTYTNTYITAVTRDGSTELKTLMFTHDPAFDPSRQEYANAKKWMLDFGVTPDQVYFFEARNAKGERKTYCGESSDLYAQYLKKFKVELSHSIIFHDGGPALKIKKRGVTSLIFEEGGNQVIVFPSIQHGRLSVLDNFLFGMAKTWWRTERTNENFAKDAVKLIQCIDWVCAKHIEQMWTANFLLNHKNITLGMVEKLMERGPKKAFSNHDLRIRYENAYEKWLAENEDMYGYEVPEDLESLLDGSYWETK